MQIVPFTLRAHVARARPRSAIRVNLEADVLGKYVARSDRGAATAAERSLWRLTS